MKGLIVKGLNQWRMTHRSGAVIFMILALPLACRVSKPPGASPIIPQTPQACCMQHVSPGSDAIIIYRY